jgi:hypothetical protein
MQALLAWIWSGHMDWGLDTTFTVLFLAGTFAAALVAGLSGFAFGLVASAVWLYILTPLQTATLIIWLGLVVQGYSVWKLRRAIRWQRIAPLVLGAAFGVPFGVFVLATAEPRYLRVAVGLVLVLYSLYVWQRPAVKALTSGGITTDVTAGFLNGLLGGATGLAGIVATMWCQWRGMPKDEQRAVFQPVGVATFAMSAIWLQGQVALSRDLVGLFALSLPVLLAGAWTGMRLYGKLDDAQFRKIVLALLMLSGVVLLFR